MQIVRSGYTVFYLCGCRVLSLKTTTSFQETPKPLKALGANHNPDFEGAGAMIEDWGVMNAPNRS